MSPDASTPIAVQLYTLREVCERDLPGALRAISEAGYRSVEFFGGFFGLAARELKRRLDDLELQVVAAHVPLEELETDFEGTMRSYEGIGCRTLVCPWLPVERRRGPGGFEEVGRILDEIGGRLRSRGFDLVYHNHEFEFTKAEGADGLELILAQCAPENLSLEPDVYWLSYAGRDPAAFIREWGPRVRLIHLKDGVIKERSFTPVGRGELDIPAILKAGEEAGVRAFVVEQDVCQEPAGESIRRSLDYLRSLGMTG